MLMSHDYEKSPIPQWALSAMTLGRELASFPNGEPGQKYLNVFLSVPTGQYVAPLIMAGALLAPPKIADPSANVGETFRAVAFDGKSQIRDLDVTLLREDFQGNPKLMYHNDGYLRLTDHPVLRLPKGVPDDRAKKVFVGRDWENIRRKFRTLPAGTAKSTESWWASHCLSPVVIVGESLEYVDNQRKVMLERAPHWIDLRVLPILEYSKPGTSNRERVFHHPYSYLTIDAARDLAWMRSFRPRLVIYTSWGAFYRRKMSAFSGAPAIVIVNRRVPSADIEASKNTVHDSSINLESAKDMPRSFGLRAELSLVLPPDDLDSGVDASTEDDDPDFGDE